MGNINHAGLHHMGTAAVLIKAFQIVLYRCSLKLPVFVGNRQHLMTAAFNCTCLVDTDMSGIRCNNPLEGL